MDPGSTFAISLDQTGIKRFPRPILPRHFKAESELEIQDNSGQKVLPFKKRDTGVVLRVFVQSADWSAHTAFFSSSLNLESLNSTKPEQKTL